MEGIVAASSFMDRRTQDLGEERLASLGLAVIPELAPRLALALIARFGSARAVLAVPAEELADAGVADSIVPAIRDAAGRGRAEAAALAAAGATFVTRSDAAYPASLREIPDPPLMLAVRGRLAEPDELAIAIVGTRRASEYGRRVAQQLARGLAQVGVTVVSGLAAGIDGAAHRAALEAGGRTIAVLGTGIDRVYPSWHAELAGAVAAQGALVSEFPCGAAPLAFHFPRRNRLISGLSLGTVVVEAAEQSGSLITAAFALEQNRQVYAVPGPVGVAGHRGPNRLIQQGGRLVTAVEDILDDLSPALRGRLAERRAAAAEATLTAPERLILEAIGSDGRHVDEVIRHAAVPAGAALETLLALELRGLVHQLPGKRFCRRAA
jgi:DNA processing protein